MATPDLLDRGLRASADDRRAARELYDFVHRFALKALVRQDVPEADREELAQRVVVAAFLGWRHFQPSRGTPEMWVSGIVRNEARMLRRARRRQPDAGRRVLDLPDDTNSPEERARIKEEVAAVWENMPEDMRSVLWLRLESDLTFEEIGNVRGISRSEADRLHKEGMRRLRAAIEACEERRRRHGVAVLPFAMDASIDMNDGPEPSSEALNRGWAAFAARFGLEDAPNSEPPPSGTRRCAPAPPADPLPPSNRPPPHQPPLPRRLRLLIPFASGVLVAVLPSPLSRCDREPGAATTRAQIAPIGIITEAVVLNREALPVPASREALSIPIPPSSSGVVARGLPSARVLSDSERALALVERARRMLHAGNLPLATQACAEHARDFRAGPGAVERDQIWTAACASARRAPTQPDGVRCVGHL